MRATLITLTLAGPLAFAGCGDEAVSLTESEGAAVISQALTARGYAPTTDDFALTGVPVCDAFENCQAPAALTLDGWDPVSRVGYEYISRDDPDFPDHPLLRSTNPTIGRINAALLEAAINAQLADGEGGTVLVLRSWAHETTDLATGQLDNEVQRRLDAAELTGP
jgi:hypothetical protein